MEECDPNPERSKGHTGINRDRTSYRLLYQEEKKTTDQLSLEQFFQESHVFGSSSQNKISYLLWLNSCMNVPQLLEPVLLGPKIGFGRYGVCQKHINVLTFQGKVKKFY